MNSLKLCISGKCKFVQGVLEAPRTVLDPPGWIPGHPKQNLSFVRFWVRRPCTEPLGQICHYLLTRVQYLANQLLIHANQLLIPQRIGARVQSALHST